MANFQLQDNFKVDYSIQELDADNNPTGGSGDTCTVTSSDTASVTVVPDATPTSGNIASGFLIGGKKLGTGIVITATPAHADGTPVAPPSTVTVDVVAGAAVTAGISLGTAVAQ